MFYAKNYLADRKLLFVEWIQSTVCSSLPLYKVHLMFLFLFHVKLKY